MSLVTSVPGFVVAGLAILLYPGVGLILPITLRWSTLQLVEANVVGAELTRDRQRKIVQCKRWISWHVGVEEIRQFQATLLNEELPGSARIFVTLADFSGAALTEAHATHVTTGVVLQGRESASARTLPDVWPVDALGSVKSRLVVALRQGSVLG